MAADTKFERQMFRGRALIREWAVSGDGRFIWRREVRVGEEVMLPATTVHAVLPSGRAVCRRDGVKRLATLSTDIPADLVLCGKCCWLVGVRGRGFLLDEKVSG